MAKPRLGKISKVSLIGCIFFLLFSFALIGLINNQYVFAFNLFTQKPNLLKNNFSLNETIDISLNNNDPNQIEIIISDFKGNEVKTEKIISDDDVKLKPISSLAPGKYHLQIKKNEKIILTQDFTWGVLAINTNKSIYKINETVKFDIGVLGEVGNVICDAKLKLIITNQTTGIVEDLSTDNEKIISHPECLSRGFSLTPDYSAEYFINNLGKYSVKLIANTANGEYSVDSFFEVQESVPFDISRQTATRIYPPATYPVIIDITANQDFSGSINEFVPKDFVIKSEVNSSLPFEIKEIDNQKNISWQVNLKIGESIQLVYNYKSPEISPQFYLLGPLKFIETQKIINDSIDSFGQEVFFQDAFVSQKNEQGEIIAIVPNPDNKNNLIVNQENIVFEEIRQWQIAADQVPSGIIIAWPGTVASIPLGWQRVTDLDGYFLEGTTSNPSAVVGGGATHVHTTTGHQHTTLHSHTGEVSSTAIGTSYPTQSGSGSSTLSNHTHTITIDENGRGTGWDTIAINSESNNPPYSDVIWIRSNGSSEIPASAWVFLDTDTLPSNWTRQNGNRFLKGASTGGNGGATGGNSDSHTHTDPGHTHGEIAHDHTGSVGLTTSRARHNTGTGLVVYTHQHGFSINFAITATEGPGNAQFETSDGQPPFYKLNIIQNNSTQSLPVGIIALWDQPIDQIPADWVICDGTNGTPNLNDKFIKGTNSDSEIGITGGSLTHTHNSGVGHTHVINSHSHQGYATTFSTTSVAIRSSGVYASGSHHHTFTASGGGLTGSSTVSVNTNADNRPPYKEIVYIQYKPSVITLTQTHYRWRDDSVVLDTNSGWIANQDNTYSDLARNFTTRLRVAVANTGSSTATNYQYQLEYAQKIGSSCGDDETFSPIPATATTEPFEMVDSSQYTDNSTVSSSFLTATGTFTSGKAVEDPSNKTQSINLSGSFYTEFEYAIKATNNAPNNSNYCFRLTNSGSISNFTYSTYPEINVAFPVLNQNSFRWSNDDGGEVHGSGGSWFNDNWNYSIGVTLTNSLASNLDNFQIGLTFPTDTLVSGGKMQSNCNDIRVVDTDNSTVLPYYLETGTCNTASTRVWLKTSISASSSKSIYIYYGNNSAENSENADSTFDFFDDFNGTSLNTNTWNLWNPYSWSSVNISGGTLSITGTSTGGSEYHGGVLTDNTFSFSDHIIETRAKWIYGGAIDTNGYFQANGIRITDTSLPATYNSGYQYYFDYFRYNGIFNTETHKYIFTKFTNGGYTDIGSLSVSNDNPTNFEIRKVAWYTSPRQVYTYSTNNGISFTTIYSATDSTWTLPTSKYLGLTISSKQGSDGSINALYDWIRVRKYASVDPSYSIGDETLNTSGATWKANENIGITDVARNENIRLRFSVANSGYLGSFNFRLQSATKGVAANCESVTSNNFSDIPTTAGSSIGVMSTSPNFSDQDNTTNQLTASASNFTAGKIVEYPSNQSNSISLSNDYFTELEYNFQLTNNAADNTSYCFRLSNSSNPLNFYTHIAELSTTASNRAPNAPTNLTQSKPDNTLIPPDSWTNSSSIKFSVGASDPDNPDNLSLCVEVKPVGSSFTNTEDSCSSGLAFSGVGITLTHTINNFSEGQYKWQARVKDQLGLYSSWVEYSGSNDFNVDLSPPSGGTVFDGNEVNIDKDFNDGSLSVLSVNWSGVDTNISGLNYYQYSIGTSIGTTDVKTWTNNSIGTSAIVSGLTLQTSAVYYFNVQAVDNAGNTQPAISSDGQFVAPSLSFNIIPSSLSFPHLNSSNNYTVGETTTIITSTNAYGGYIVRSYLTGLLNSSGSTIPNFDGGTYSSPDAWLPSDIGFGYHSSDTTINGSNIFNNNPCPGGNPPPCFSPFSLSYPGDIVADHTGNVTGTPITNEQFVIDYKIKTSPGQLSSTYSTTAIYLLTVKY